MTQAAQGDAPHALVVVDDALAIYTAPGQERLLRAFGTRAAEPVLPPPDNPRHERTPERVAQLAAELGLRRIRIPAAFSPMEA